MWKGLTVTTVPDQRIDRLVQNIIPKLFIGSLFIFFLYLVDYSSNRVSFVFTSGQSIQDLYPYSINFYFLGFVSLLFLLTWIVTFYRSIKLFFNKYFTFTSDFLFQDQLFKINIIAFSFILYIVYNFFNPNELLLFGIITLLRQLEVLLTLNFASFPSILTVADYYSFSSLLLLISVAIVCVSVLYFFIFHCIFYFHKMSGLSNFVSLNYSNALIKALLFMWGPVLLIYLSIIYFMASSILLKLLILMTILALLLWLIYKITSSYYYGFDTQWISRDVSKFSLLFVVLVFFVFPVVFWYLNDFVYFYLNTTTQNTILNDFGPYLFANGIVPKTVISQPWTMDPVVLLFLTIFSVHRVVLLDVIMIVFFSFGMLIFMQFKYIYTYFKSKVKTNYSDQLKEDNYSLYNFNHSIQKHKLLHYLFVLFILFLVWDIALVIVVNFIQSITGNNSINVNDYIVIKSIITYFNQFQAPVNSLFVFISILVFVTTLVVFNTVSILLHKKSLKESYVGAIHFLIISFIEIIAYLIYDLQNYNQNYLSFFEIIPLSNYISLNYTIFIYIVYFCDLLFVLLAVSFILLQLYINFYAKKKNKGIEEFSEQKAKEIIKKLDDIETKIEDEPPDT